MGTRSGNVHEISHAPIWEKASPSGLNLVVETGEWAFTCSKPVEVAFLFAWDLPRQQLSTVFALPI